MDWKKFWPTLIPIAGTLLTLLFTEFGPVIAAFLAAHPTWGGVVITAIVALANAVQPKKS